jgi:hypothetical protein
MNKVIKFPHLGISITKQHCDCGYPLHYFLGEDENAYGICERCDLGSPTKITIPCEDLEH